MVRVLVAAFCVALLWAGSASAGDAGDPDSFDGVRKTQGIFELLVVSVPVAGLAITDPATRSRGWPVTGLVVGTLALGWDLFWMNNKTDGPLSTSTRVIEPLVAVESFVVIGWSIGALLRPARKTAREVSATPLVGPGVLGLRLAF